MKHSEKLVSSSGMMRRSITSMPRLRASPMTVCRRDAVEETVGDRRVNFAVLDEENVRAGAFGDAAFPVQHHGVGIAFALGPVLGDGADHVEAGRLGKARRGLADRAGDSRQGRAGFLSAAARDRNSSAIPSSRWRDGWCCSAPNAHHFGAAPGDRTDIGFLPAVFVDHQLFGGVDLGDRIGNFKIEDIGGALQPFGMLGALEDLPP